MSITYIDKILQISMRVLFFMMCTENFQMEIKEKKRKNK